MRLGLLPQKEGGGVMDAGKKNILDLKILHTQFPNWLREEATKCSSEAKVAHNNRMEAYMNGKSAAFEQALKILYLMLDHEVMP